MDLFYDVLQTKDKVCGFNPFSQLGLGWMINIAVNHKYESKIILAGNDYLSVDLVRDTIFPQFQDTIISQD